LRIASGILKSVFHADWMSQASPLGDLCEVTLKWGEQSNAYRGIRLNREGRAEYQLAPSLFFSNIQYLIPLFPQNPPAFIQDYLIMTKGEVASPKFGYE